MYSSTCPARMTPRQILAIMVPPASLDHLLSYLAGNGGQWHSHLPRRRCGHSADRGGYADRSDRSAAFVENGDADRADAVLALARVTRVAALAYLLQLCKQDRLAGDRAGSLGRQRLAGVEAVKFFVGQRGKHRLSDACRVRRKHPAGPPGHPQGTLAFHGVEEAGVCPLERG